MNEPISINLLHHLLRDAVNNTLRKRGISGRCFNVTLHDVDETQVADIEFTIHDEYRIASHYDGGITSMVSRTPSGFVPAGPDDKPF